MAFLSLPPYTPTITSVACSAGRCVLSICIDVSSLQDLICALESSGGRDRVSSVYTPAENLSERDQSMTEQAEVSVTAETPKKTTGTRAAHKGKTRTKRASHNGSSGPVASTSKVLQPSRSSSLHNTTITPTTPRSNPKTTARPTRSASEPRLKSVLETPKNPKGKRKADDLEVTPPDFKNGQHATFAIPPEARREYSFCPFTSRMRNIRLRVLRMLRPSQRI